MDVVPGMVVDNVFADKIMMVDEAEEELFKLMTKLKV